jgi:hypothetical protein
LFFSDGPNGVRGAGSHREGGGSERSRVKLSLQIGTEGPLGARRQHAPETSTKKKLTTCCVLPSRPSH